MPIDTSIYQNIRSVEMPSFADAQQKAMTLSSLAMQNQRMGKQMEQEDRDAKYAEHLRKATAFGGALENLSGLPEQERAAAYPKVRQELIGSGILKNEDAPEQYDPGFYKQNLFKYRQSKEYMDRALTKSQIAKNYADAEKDRAAAHNKGAGLEAGSNLRKEWTALPTTKATQDVAQSIERVRNAYANPSAAGDLTMIYSFMKMNDPGSTVREGEFATAQNAAGVPERVRAQWNKMMSGERLTDEQRTDFAQQAERMYGGQINAQKTVDSQYEVLAQRYGVDPSLVMMKFPEPRELKLAIKKEEQKPGWLAGLFGSKTAQAAPASKRPDFNSMSNEELMKFIGSK